MAKVKRKLTFYAWDSIYRGQEFDAVAAYDAVKGLSQAERVLNQDDSLTSVTAHKKGSGSVPSQFLLLPLRDYENRPSRYKPGTALKPVTIGSDEYVSDVSHVTLWPDGFAAYDAHGSAPGPTRLAAYFAAKIDAHLEFVPLYNRDLLDRLKGLDDLTSIEYGISRSEKAERAVNSGKGLFRGLVATIRGDEEISFGTRISVGNRRNQSLDDDLQSEIIELAPKAEDYFDSLWVTGTKKIDGKRVTERINLLQERVKVEAELKRAVGGGDRPDANACFSAIVAAKKKLDKTNELTHAVRARPKPTKLRKRRLRTDSSGDAS